MSKSVVLLYILTISGHILTNVHLVFLQPPGLANDIGHSGVWGYSSWATWVAVPGMDHRLLLPLEICQSHWQSRILHCHHTLRPSVGFSHQRPDSGRSHEGHQIFPWTKMGKDDAVKGKNVDILSSQTSDASPQQDCFEINSFLWFSGVGLCSCASVQLCWYRFWKPYCIQLLQQVSRTNLEGHPHCGDCRRHNLSSVRILRLLCNGKPGSWAGKKPVKVYYQHHKIIYLWHDF